MIFIKCFIVGGLICAFAQFLMDKFKILPIYVTCLFVTLGSVLSAFGIYQKLVKFSGFGASLPISSFGASITQSAIEQANITGYIGVLEGLFSKTSVGIGGAIIISFLIALIFKPIG